MDTDTKLNDSRYTTHLKRWEMEETRREVRIAMKESIWSRADAWWQSVVLNQDVKHVDERGVRTPRYLAIMDNWSNAIVGWADIYFPWYGDRYQRYIENIIDSMSISRSVLLSQCCLYPSV